MTYSIANQMEQGIHHPFDDDFVEFRILAVMSIFTFLCVSRSKPRTTKRIRSKICAMGTIRTADHGLV